MSDPEVTGADHSVHIADLVVARVAAHHAGRVPGVVALRPGGSRAVAALAGMLAPGSGRNVSPVDGVSAQVDGAMVDIDLDIVVALGAACVEVVSRLQREVVEAVRLATGLESTVSVDIVDVVDDGVEPLRGPT